MRTYLTLLLICTLAIAPFPTGLLRIDVPSTPTRYTILGYDRASAFGPGWAPLPGGCDTRTAAMSHAWGGVPCTAPLYAWDVQPIADPYTGRPIMPTDVELDHLFPLAAAWDMGAYTWPRDKRLAFANDPANLVVTSTAANQAKSDQLPSEWLPPDWRARCAYSRQLAHVAAKYALPLPAADQRAMRRSCAGLKALASRRSL
ncbi:HNH endonuclease [Corynebacterium sp. CNCTC7651]|uniref:HNH endonuclease family protein n=1 Tax=Corynebacterium sp. CNCTC7651 TaxID=2815361 RepID=UPI001F19B216|nr:HNH endonuclease family protein [Corynebacterium sp. CNCTC7651]UIZ92929.1 HNH endonuclease [Corynebacterium sp. CNCTC7651]